MDKRRWSIREDDNVWTLLEFVDESKYPYRVAICPKRGGVDLVQAWPNEEEGRLIISAPDLARILEKLLDFYEQEIPKMETMGNALSFLQEKKDEKDALHAEGREVLERVRGEL